ncbi:FRG domain protein [Pseudomonas ogarae]|uniref:FRG domain-containing protein n=1 Tax=Pseudomonas ogarae (strain DSM 112162 / CECT 30235 / F113) TaxID=1114970 RepID=UPI001C0EBFBC|nr:FRG domain-containing protein [Pseudomonas ogarae]PBJ21175.1 FRG domain protein [Pseudomonas ogarae]
MGRTSRWTSTPVSKGVKVYTLSSWKYFSDFINQEMLDYTTYVYRGHGNSEWKLEPTIDRLIKYPRSDKRAKHLERFKFATRGRRGPNPIKIEDENDWWALGQHHGLATPLLDWTESPFVALYFAANSAKAEKTKHLTVFAIAQESISNINISVRKNEALPLINNRKQTIKIVRPLSDENARLVSQRGLFTRGPNNVDLETWMTNNSPAGRTISLMKIIIPTTGMEECLRYLNRMNINHSTLFPDLPGASEFCNKYLVIDDY